LISDIVLVALAATVFPRRLFAIRCVP